MANDNTLGAPTEGLGQKVTFAFDPASGGVPQLELGGTSTVRAGVPGTGVQGGIVQGTGVTAAPNPTLDILTKFGDALIRPRLEKAKQDAFFTGMQRAVQGEAVADIAKDQPWYTTIFGEADAVEGARAYAGSAVASTTMTSLEERMPELRKLGPTQMQSAVSKLINDSMTGDRPTDASVLRSLTAQLPSVYRRQAKEHYGWLQENAAVQEAAAFKAGADRLQGAAQGMAQGYTTPEDFSVLVDDFRRSVAPAAGREERTYKESMKDNLVGWAKQGKFHALNALKSSGFFEVLTPDQLEAVTLAERHGNAKVRSEYNVKWNDELVNIRLAAEMPQEGKTMNDLAAMIDSANAKFKAETGSTETWITANERAAYLTRNGREIAQELQKQIAATDAQANKERAAGLKAQAAATESVLVTAAATAGQLGALAVTRSKDKIDADWFPKWLAMAGNQPPGMLSKEQIQNLVVNAGSNYKIGPVEDYLVGQVTSVLSAGAMTPEAEVAINNFAAINDVNPSVALMYYGQHASRLAGYNTAVRRNGQAALGAFNEWFLLPKKNASLSSKEMQEAVSVIGEGTRWWQRPFTGQSSIKAGQARRLALEMADGIQEFAPIDGVMDATRRTMGARINRDFEMLGGYFVPIMKDQKSLQTYLTTSTTASKAIGTDKLNEVFEDAIDELLRNTGADKASDTFIGRMPDKDGVPVFIVQSVVDGKPRNGVLKGTDIFALAEKAAAKRVKPTAQEMQRKMREESARRINDPQLYSNERGATVPITPALRDRQ